MTERNGTNLRLLIPIWTIFCSYDVIMKGEKVENRELGSFLFFSDFYFFKN